MFISDEVAVDTLGPLIVRERQLCLAIQAVALLEQPSLGSAKSSLPPRYWAQEMEDKELASQEGV